MKIKKILVILIACFTFSFLINGKKAEAAKGDLAGEKKSDYAYAINDLYTKGLLGDVTLYKQQVKTLQNGTGSTWNYSTFSWVDVPATSKNVNVVVWTMSEKNGWKSGTVKNIASDYEKNHPGWIVVAGINGDFFEIKSTGEPSNISVQEGEVYQPHTLSDVDYRAGLGFIGNDFTNYIYGEVSIDSNLSIELLENGVVKETKVITNVNDTLSETGINLITKDNKTKVNLEGYKVLVGNYEINRMRLNNNKKVFVKGTITSSENYGEVTGAPTGEFILASKDGSLDDFVKVGDYVRCQYKLTEDWANVQSAIGYVYKVVENGKTLHKASSDVYPKTNNPHTYIGFKKDGSVVLMVNEGRGTQSSCQEGVTLFQGGEMLRLAGCVTAFNLDGGGSTTLVARNERGGLDTINVPSDGSERADGNAILVVMKDPNINYVGKNITRNSMTFEKEDATHLKNITISINNQVYEFFQNSIEITGLEEDTEYEVAFAYDVETLQDKEKYIHQVYKTTVKTKQFIPPAAGLDVEEIGKNQITITKQETDYSSWIQNVVVYVGGVPYNMGNESTFVIDGLFDDTKYEVKFKYNVIEPNNPKVYTYEETPFNIKTLAFNLPTFEKFEISEFDNNSFSISYQYKDPDAIVEKMYVVVYGENGKEISRKELDKKRGTVSLSGFDLTTQQYSIKLEASYYMNEEDTLLSTYYSNEIQTELYETKKKGCKKKTASLMVATLAVASLAVLVFRKKK